MGRWSNDVYFHKWNDTNGICEWCNKPIIGRGVLHHIINRSHSGKDTYENAELRHADCEKYAHEHYKYGNRSNEMNTAHKPRKVKPKRFNHQQVVFREKRNEQTALQEYTEPRPQQIQPEKIANSSNSGISLTIGNAIVTFRQNGTSYQINVDPVH